MYNKDLIAEGYKTLETVEEIKKIGKPIHSGLAQFFNGTLINKNIIAKVGFPNKDFFIWGDELEYVLRIQKSGYKTYTVSDSYIVHPAPLVKTFTFLGRARAYVALSPVKQYYSLRNQFYISRLYKLSNGATYTKFVFRTFKQFALSIIINDRMIKRFIYVIMAFTDGFLGRIYINRLVK